MARDEERLTAEHERLLASQRAAAEREAALDTRAHEAAESAREMAASRAALAQRVAEIEAREGAVGTRTLGR